jgi:hypothetical protein
MESIQQQIAALTHKVDSVYQLIQSLDWSKNERSGQWEHKQADNNSCDVSNRETVDWRTIHQDILIDSNGMEVNQQHFQEYDIAPQIQVQRLTAQLTAAYNRIAALEEQLLAKRWH